jgi:hypothetical protein
MLKTCSGCAPHSIEAAAHPTVYADRTRRTAGGTWTRALAASPCGHNGCGDHRALEADVVEEREITVRMFGLLHGLRTEQGLPTTVTMTIPSAGQTAAEIATGLELPLESIEGVFCNHTIYGLDKVIVPGDRVAFVPYGTPGPHRFMLGLYDAGKQTRSSHAG